MRRAIRTRDRRGAALVEAAICLPLILLLVVASIEMSNGIFQQHAVRAAAHECARVAASSEKDALDVQHVANEVLMQRGLDNFDIAIDVQPRTVNVASVASPAVSHFNVPSSGLPTDGLANLPRGTLLKLKIAVNRPPGPVGGWFLGDVIYSQVFFVKER